jgi:hypothetical protein
LPQELQEIVEAARAHLENLIADINNASTRLEHVRLTALAQEAENLYTELIHYQNSQQPQE